MPIDIDPTGNAARSLKERLARKDIKYEYPNGLKLKPGDKNHDDLAAYLYQMAHESRRQMEVRFHYWDKINHSLSAYVPLSEAEQEVKKGDERKPVSIVVPVAYAALETLLAYFTSVFLQDPIFRYLPSGPEDPAKTYLLELVVNQQVRKTKIALSLHTMWRDGFAYGIGAVVNSWRVKHGKRTRRKSQNRFSSLLKKFIPDVESLDREDVTLFEANELINIDPYNFLPDPNRPIEDVESMEHVGWVDRDSYMSLLSDEESGNYGLFNVRYLNDISDCTSRLFKDSAETGRGDRWGNSGTTKPNYSKPVDVIWQFVDLIPSEWGLGDGDYPETWHLGLAADNLIIFAERSDPDHGMKPIRVFAPEYDGHSGTPLARLEMVYGLQETIDWFFSAHIHNVRKTINNITIVDPYLVNYSDVIDPKPGGVWRLRRAAWGRGVENVAKQLGTTDITRNHVADVLTMMDIANRVTATTDPIMGVQRTRGERVSATESQGVQTGGMVRLARLAAICGMQVNDDLGLMFAANTIQYMDSEVYVRAVGRWEEELRGIYSTDKPVMVSPFDIDTYYDVESVDATFPNAENGQLWVQLFQVIAGTPMLMQKIDTFRLFKHVAKTLGAKNLSDFEVKAQTAAPDQIDQQLQQGNLIPLEGEDLGF